MTWQVTDSWAVDDLIGEPVRTDRVLDLWNAWKEKYFGSISDPFTKNGLTPPNDGTVGRGRDYIHDIQVIHDATIGSYVNHTIFDPADDQTWVNWSIAALETDIGISYPGSGRNNGPVKGAWMHWMYEASKRMKWRTIETIGDSSGSGLVRQVEGIGATIELQKADAETKWLTEPYVATGTLLGERDYSYHPSTARLARFKQQYVLDYVPNAAMPFDGELNIYFFAQAESTGNFDPQGWTGAVEDQLYLMETKLLSATDPTQDQIHGYYTHADVAPAWEFPDQRHGYFGIRLDIHAFKPFIKFDVTGGFDYL